MKQVFIRKGNVVLETVPAPVVEPRHVLVEVAYSLVSTGTEMDSVKGSGMPVLAQAVQQPHRVAQLLDHLRTKGLQRTIAKVRESLEGDISTGYSSAGIVLQVGPEVEGIRPGDRVACAGARHAEIILVPRNLVARVPPGCNLKAAASATIGAIALQGVRRSDPRLGEIIAVIGLGLLGQLTVQLLKANGCQVIGLDLDPRRVQLAKTLGADAALISDQVDVGNEILHLTQGHGVDGTIITAASGSNALVQQAMQITRKRGRVVIVGAVGLGLQRSPFYEKEIDFLISCSYGPGRYDPQYEQAGQDYPYAYVRWTENRNMAEYLRLVAQGRINLDLVLEREYSLEEVGAAYEVLKAEGSERPLGVVLRYPLGESSLTMAKQAKAITLPARPVANRINLAIVGAGSFAKSMHLPNIQALSSLYQLRTVVSRTGENARATARQFGAPQAATSLEEALADPAVDAVLICTRHHLHAQQTLAALKTGKAVFVEKPLCLSLTELSDILAFYGLTLSDFESGAQPVVTGQPLLTVGFNRRFSPPILKLKELVAQRKNPLVAVYRVNAGYVAPQNWVHGPEGGGRLVGEACHMVDVLRFLVGAPVCRFCAAAVMPRTEHVLSSDNAALTLEYEDGSVCTLVYTALGASELGKEQLEVFWDGKAAVLDDYRSLCIKGLKGQDWNSPQIDKGHRQALEAFGQSLKSLSANWPISLSELVETSRITLGIAT